MKLDLLKNQWLEIVFEGRNKKYGAYDLRRSITKNTVRSFIIGTLVFAFLVSIPTLIRMIPDSSEDVTIDTKIRTVKMPPKKEKPKDPNLPPPPPPAPKVDQVKFVKPVVAKAEDVVEEIAKVEDLKDKNIGKEAIKGNPDAELTVDMPTGHGTEAVVEEDNTVYNTAGIEVKPEFPGGIEKFYKFVEKNYQFPDEEGLNGKVYVTFVVEKDGSLTDIKVLRDIGYGTGKEAIRVLKACPKWSPGEQNGKKVRCTYSLPIAIKTE
ncbi:outer membrane transport energization protein TonB [Flavobacterium fluvii]|uniref:Outer membrane transport energization protein TonB n=1 Tax=Flavobacterium fluvii TaxID=468056 RepID=A0A1M5DNT9_9FLAO|nr:energy transducer TonB [Flavobacterium fluvii]SHF68698.1 outer membrane transport energization protein TonB [Flavobacterium fluvii]